MSARHSDSSPPTQRNSRRIKYRSLMSDSPWKPQERCFLGGVGRHAQRELPLLAAGWAGLSKHTGCNSAQQGCQGQCQQYWIIRKPPSASFSLSPVPIKMHSHGIGFSLSPCLLLWLQHTLAISTALEFICLLLPRQCLVLLLCDEKHYDSCLLSLPT